ncbi:putative acid phosphatase [Xylaria telfairii]|nr:putative acid phosphatase [Xylaria telfairii]
MSLKASRPALLFSITPVHTMIPSKPPAYTPEELRELYPNELQLKQVFVFIRHGERTPTSARFHHIGLNPFWNQCGNIRKFMSVVLSGDTSGEWEELKWRRKLETFDDNGKPRIASDGKERNDKLCGLGELTDIGRESMLDLGRRLRRLYVEQLKFLPPVIEETEDIHLRCSHLPRTLESLHQTFLGLYPASCRGPRFEQTVVMRDEKEEIIMPNESHCPRFVQMMKAYTRYTAARWNGSPEMEYVNQKLQSFMPKGEKIAVDSKPKIAGIYDTINATLGANDPSIRLPAAFYEERILKILDKIAYEEEFGPFSSNHEYRVLGIGPLMSDIVHRMVRNIATAPPLSGSLRPVQSALNASERFYLGSGHDSTIMPILSAMGALQIEDQRWPKFSSTATVELFHDGSYPNSVTRAAPIQTTPTSELTTPQKELMTGWYVRLRYNNKEMSVPGCQKPGKHFKGRPTFCTLAAFKEIVDKMTPADWKAECNLNLDKPAIPDIKQPAGF